MQLLVADGPLDSSGESGHFFAVSTVGGSLRLPYRSA